MDSFIDVIEKFTTTDKEKEPSFPYKENLSNIPVNRSQEEINNAVSQLSERRKTLHGMIKRDGWQWEDIATGI